MQMKRLLPIILLAVVVSGCHKQTKFVPGPDDTIALQACPQFDSLRAMATVEAQCKFGPRVAGSEASRLCGDYLIKELRALGLEVEEQTSEATRYDGEPVSVRNIIARLNPEARSRFLLCAHWDSRPWADQDADSTLHRTPILGANDGASGVAVLLEMARCLKEQPIQSGVDFVLFDAEDMGTPTWAENDSVDTTPTWCLGSQAWASKAFMEGYDAMAGVLFDMVGGRGTSFAREGLSVYHAKNIVDTLWQIARQLGYADIFQDRDGGYLVDDHAPVNQTANIPCVDIVANNPTGVSFGPTWHTTQDTPENIDPHVLRAAGQTVLQWIYNEDKK